jgi:hypothetical protein
MRLAASCLGASVLVLSRFPLTLGGACISSPRHPVLPHVDWDAACRFRREALLLQLFRVHELTSMYTSHFGLGPDGEPPEEDDEPESSEYKASVDAHTVIKAVLHVTKTQCMFALSNVMDCTGFDFHRLREAEGPSEKCKEMVSYTDEHITERLAGLDTSGGLV